MNNPLLISTVVANILYWTIGFASPDPFISSASSLFLLVSSAIMFLRYFPTAYDVLIHRQRDTGQGGEGSHVGVYGATLIAAGSCYVGLFGFLWVLAGQPPEWLGTAYSGYGRAVSGAGFVLMAFSPTIASGTFRPANIFMIILLITAIAVASFFVGRISQPETASYWTSIKGRLANRPLCPEGQQVFGTERKIYHSQESPYRGMVIPSWCFSSPAEAEEKGFRVPEGLVGN
ncbi:hypothetical protein [Agrobacterium larrymoorei]|uniref:hypothetical protein n=1 Tax=Agrobacterium larrymoorei TaxID=160699 RepID=UPI0030BC7E25